MIVLAGDGGSGKTTVARYLCGAHGFTAVPEDMPSDTCPLTGPRVVAVEQSLTPERAASWRGKGARIVFIVRKGNAPQCSVNAHAILRNTGKLEALPGRVDALLAKLNYSDSPDS